MKIAICTPTLTRPHDAYLESLLASVPALDETGIEHATVFEVGCPYISHARCTMLTKALNWGADEIVFIDHDMSWRPEDLVRLIETRGEVVAGLYRFKTDGEKYMGVLDTDSEHRPIMRADGCIRALRVPAGFLKVTRHAVEKFKESYPELCIKDGIGVDLFNHGCIEGIWYGEDYAFSKRWLERGGDIWVVPGMNLGHHSSGHDYWGNYFDFLCRQPGGSHHHEADNEHLSAA